jgi:hypothetical protein
MCADVSVRFMSSCPKCECDDVKTPSFTWWGGALGAHVLRHRICRLCSFAFYGKTGASNRRAVIAYVLATNTLLVALLSFAERLAQQ